MAIRDLLLPLMSYPKPTETGAIEAVVRLAENLSKPFESESDLRTIRTRVSALVCEVEIEAGLYFEGADIGTFLETQSRKSAANAQLLSKTFDEIAVRHKILHRCRIERRSSYHAFNLVVDEARLCNLTAFPMRKDDGGQRDIAQQLIFEAGRPILIFPEYPVRKLSHSFENIAVAWDASRPAARAIADAMPFLRRAKTVRIFTATDDKPMTSSGQGQELIGHLALNGVKATFDEVKKTDSHSIGTFMEAYIADHQTDLLVMGAYGHSRLREFVLGGATRSILTNPPGWILMSH